MTRPTRDSLAGRVYLDLQNLARTTGRPTEELLVLYALEGLLDRLSTSSHAGNLVLKGGVLLAAYDARRPTRDIDLATAGVSNDTDTVLALIRSVAAVSREDGLVFDVSGARADTIRDEDAYSGVRVSLDAHLDRARLAVHVDVNVGDPVWPPPGEVRLARLLGGHLLLRGYPLEMVYAEKILTALDRGTANTRWRDFADLYLLTRRHPVDGAALNRALRVVADHRGTPLRGLTGTLVGYADLAQRRWDGWVRRQHLTDRLPTDFTAVLTAVSVFTDPALTGHTEGLSWDPHRSSWTAPPPTR